jgi:hypothetical protein
MDLTNGGEFGGPIIEAEATELATEVEQERQD